jgi:hypothetical protein
LTRTLRRTQPEAERATPEQELEALEAELRDLRRVMDDAVASEANGGDPKTARATYERAAGKAEALKPRREQLRAVVKAIRERESSERETRRREHEALSAIVRQMLAGHRFTACCRLPEKDWPAAWEWYKRDLAAWVQRRRAEAADPEDGTIPGSAKAAIASAEAILATPIEELVAQTHARRRSLSEA